MNNANNIQTAERLINNIGGTNVKYIKKERGLIERKDTEDKLILVEDNRQILLG